MSEIALNSLYSYLTSTLSLANQQWLASRLLENSRMLEHKTTDNIASSVRITHHTSPKIEALKLHPTMPIPDYIKMEDIYEERKWPRL